MRVTGVVKMLGEGTAVGMKHERRSLVAIGDVSIRNLRIPRHLGNYVWAGDDVALGVHSLLWFKFLLAVATTDGKVHRVGAFRTAIGAISGLAITLFLLRASLRFSAACFPLALLTGVCTVQNAVAFRTAVAFESYP